MNANSDIFFTQVSFHKQFKVKIYKICSQWNWKLIPWSANVTCWHPSTNMVSSENQQERKIIEVTAPLLCTGCPNLCKTPAMVRIEEQQKGKICESKKRGKHTSIVRMLNVFSIFFLLLPSMNFPFLQLFVRWETKLLN